MPDSSSSRPARSSAARATWLKAPPTEMRATPSCASSATVGRPGTVSTLTGRSTEATTLRMSSAAVSPGAYRTSAPASWYACSRLIVSARLGFPRMKFSARAVSTSPAPAAAATRSVASARS